MRVRGCVAALTLLGVAACTTAGRPSAGASSTAPTTPGAASLPSPYPAPVATDPPGIKAPRAERIAETDEFGLVAGQRRALDAVQIDVDRVYMLSGKEAEAEATKRGRETPVSDDYLLVNDSHQLRSYLVSPQAVVWGSIRMTRQGEPSRVSLQRWLDYLRTDMGHHTLFHFQVQDGIVVAVEEQYQP